MWNCAYNYNWQRLTIWDFIETLRENEEEEFVEMKKFEIIIFFTSRFKKIKKTEKREHLISSKGNEENDEEYSSIQNL